jgi:hypothetical protein
MSTGHQANESGLGEHQDTHADLTEDPQLARLLMLLRRERMALDPVMERDTRADLQYWIHVHAPTYCHARHVRLAARGILAAMGAVLRDSESGTLRAVAAGREAELAWAYLGNALLQLATEGPLSTESRSSAKYLGEL